MSEPDVLVPGLTAAESSALEALFAQDLPGAPPAVIDRRLGLSLTKKGLAEPTHFMVGNGPFAVKVDTFHITVAGHMAYCAACPDPEPDDRHRPVALTTG